MESGEEDGLLLMESGGGGGDYETEMGGDVGGVGGPPGGEGYSLCLNESLINITISSIFCSKNFTYPNYGENVSFI